jgi:hypothetical protein
MITSHCLRTWLRWLVCAALALVAERAILGRTWPFVLAALLTLILFTAFTKMMYEEWRTVMGRRSRWR